MHPYLRATFWILLYLLLVQAPLFVLLLGPKPAGDGFWFDFSLALGFAATAMMAIMFLLTARFQRATAPFGIDLVYYFHRLAAIGAFVFVTIHPLVLFYKEPGLLRVILDGTLPLHLWTGLVSWVALAALMVSSLWRKSLHIHYDAWRVAHVLLALTALLLGVAHIVGVGHYSATFWKTWLWLGIALSCLTAAVRVRLVKPLQLLRRPWRVARVIEERGSSWTLVLRPEGHGGFRYLPGQFAWLTLRSSPFAMREHPFSISSSAATAGEISFTIKELGDFTNRIGEIRVGETAWIDGPYGTFSIDISQAPGYVFVAGGVGIAPIMSMLRTLADRGDRRPLLLFYAYHTWERTTFREELEELRERIDLTVVYVLSEPPADWEGEQGLLREEIFARRLPADRAARECFICGPTPMIAVAEKALARQGIALTHIHSEIFDLV